MKKVIVCTWLAMILLACSKDQIVSEDSLNGQEIYASIEGIASRVQLNEQKQTVWTADDVIVVCGPEQYPKSYGFNGQTGDSSGTFSLQNEFLDRNYPASLFDKYYAVYHAYKMAMVGKIDNTPILLVGSKATQSYIPSSYGVYANVMVGTSTDGRNFSFQNLFGYLRIALIGNRSVSKIELIGNSEEPLFGYCYITIKNPTDLIWYQEGGSILTLDCGAGVQLSNTPTDFYFAMPPVTFEKGFSVTVYFVDGTTYSISTSKQIAIERNTIQPMATYAVDNMSMRLIRISHTGTYIMAPRIRHFDENVVVQGTISWGDGVWSKIGELSRYDYQDGQPSHEVVIESPNGTSMQLKGCYGVTKIDMSNF